MNTILLRRFFLIVISLSFMPQVFASQAQDLTDFITCVTNASGPQWNGTTGSCTLPYYSTAYMISSTITINSSSIRFVSTGSGGTAQTSPQATLMRDVSSVTGSSPTSFAILAAGTPTQNLLIESLVIDGNRGGLNSLSATPLLCLCLTGSCSGQTTVPSGDNWIDLDLRNAGYALSGTWPGVSVYDVTFQNGPEFSVAMGQHAYMTASKLCALNGSRDASARTDLFPPLA